MGRPLRDSLLVSAGALALFGLIRFAFNVVGIRVFGPEYVGAVGATISTLTVVAVVLASVPSVLATKFIAEYRGAGEAERAHRLFSGVVIASGLTGLLVAGVLVLLDRPTGVAASAVYVPLFGFYLVFKGTYFAYTIHRLYLRAEVAGACAFGVVFSAACIWHNASLATASLLVHPLVFALVAAIDHREYFRGRGGLAELAQEWRRYGVYSIATFVNAMNGLGSYHLLVVFASMFLDVASLGYLNVILATLAPLNLIPTAYGAAAFPEMSRRYGLGDVQGLRTLLRRSTIALQAFAVLAIGPILIAPSEVFALVHIPTDRGLILTWCCIAASLLLNTTSAPTGHFLNATRHVVRHAMLSGFFLVVGTAIGLGALREWGVIGAGIMRLALDGPLAWARMALAEGSVHWMEGQVVQVLGGQLAILALFASAVVSAPPAFTLALWAVAVGLQLPALVGALRARTPGNVP